MKTSSRNASIAAFLMIFVWLGCASDRGSTGDGAADSAERTQPAEVVDLPDEPQLTASSAFWDHWGDGKAELSRYSGQISRYGELRDAEVVLIYVTEPMDRSVWIKDDRADEDARVNVLKLNHVAKFQTGIYPYTVMTSVFSPVDDWGRPRFQPTKITLTAQEWCGHVFHGLWAGSEQFLSEMHSYFADEGDQRRTANTPPDTLYEDGMFIQLRELDDEFLAGQADGAKWEGHIVPRLWQRRKAHDAIEAVPASIERSETTLEDEPVTRFELTYRREAGNEAGDQTVVYYVEKAHPRRILRWERSDGSYLELEKTTRLPYWELNEPGDERHRRQLGLEESTLE